MEVGEKAVGAMQAYLRLKRYILPSGIAREALQAAAPHLAAGQVNVDNLAQEIRRVDGNHDKGAAALAEALMPFLSALEPYAGRAAVLDELVRAATSAFNAIQHYAETNVTTIAVSQHLNIAIAAAIRALHPQADKPSDDGAQGEGWLPIESAPKDETEIVGWHKVAGPSQTRFYDGEWCCVDWNEDQYIACTWEPSHWRPLPSAPSQEVAG